MSEISAGMKPARTITRLCVLLFLTFRHRFRSWGRRRRYAPVCTVSPDIRPAGQPVFGSLRVEVAIAQIAILNCQPTLDVLKAILGSLDIVSQPVALVVERTKRLHLFLCGLVGAALETGQSQQSRARHGEHVLST